VRKELRVLRLDPGLDVEILTGAIRLFERRYGKRMCGPWPAFRDFVTALAAADRAYKRLARDEGKKGQKTKGKRTDAQPASRARSARRKAVPARGPAAG
jgi:hypothetical protein